MAIQSNGSFTATATQTGVFDNAKAKFTYSFAGRFRPATASGPPTATGTYATPWFSRPMGLPRPARRMSSRGPRPTTATGPDETVAAPGRYSAPVSSGHCYGFSFFVSPGGTSMVNVAVTDILACTPSRFVPK